MNKNDLILEKLKTLGWIVCSRVRDGIAGSCMEKLSEVAREGNDDTIYELDRITESFIEEYFEKEVRPHISCRLIAEGLPEEGIVFSGSGLVSDAEITVLMDPIDGTRGLMYGKRSAWCLTGSAPGAGPELTMRDINIAVQTEIPPPRCNIAEQLFAVKGKGARGIRSNIDSGVEVEFTPAPSRAETLHYGFATFSRFFPGTKDLITAIEIELNRRLEKKGEKIFYFEDQYISSGGQLAELATGRDRFVCDLRAAIGPHIVARGEPFPLCTHPYDLCTALVAMEAGVIVTDETGDPLSAPLDTTTSVSWVGYANNSIRELVEQDFLDILRTKVFLK